MQTIAEQIEKLREEIRRHDTLYYTFNAPELTDVEYDKLFRQLQLLELEHPELVTDDSPTQRVGGTPVAGLEEVEHLVPMLSIDNAYTLSAVEAFDTRMQKALGSTTPTYAVDWKIDGCALSLVYEDGELVRAVTRGDGAVGDDITHNARAIRGVPHSINSTFSDKSNLDYEINVQGIVELRGEAYIPPDIFAALVAQQEVVGKTPFKNARNAAAGALRQQNPAECYRRGLHFVMHGFGQFDPTPVNDSYHATLLALRARGVPIIKDAAGQLPFPVAQQLINDMVERMDQAPYPVDGIVLKLDKFSDRKTVGQVSTRHVSWALAYKWEKYEARTKIVRLETQVGKQGTLTPVAYYEPVEIAETTVRKSTLFNFDEVERVDPRVGDVVTLEKAGKIIPHLVRVHKDMRKGRTRKFAPPKKCPKCGTETTRLGSLVICPNTVGCPAQLEAVILSAADRSRLDIDGLGPKAVQAMFAAGVLEDFASLWTLKDAVSDSGAIPGMTPGKSRKLLAALEEAKTRPSWRLLASLNIRHCGRTNSELICRAIHALQRGTVPDVFEVLQKSWTIQNLRAVDGVGEETAISVLTWFEKPRNIRMLGKLRKLGFNMGAQDPIEEVEASGPRPLAGLSICATGKLQDFTRDGIKQAITRAGGKASSSVSKSTDYLVAGADAGSKLQKAESLGVKVINETEFKQLAGI